MRSRKFLTPLVTGLAILTNVSAFATTLPNSKLPRSRYLQQLAERLGWQPQSQTNTLCLGTYKLPQYLRKHSVIDNQAPLQISARGAEVFKQHGISELSKEVVITQPGRILYADKVFLFRNEKTAKIYRVVLVGQVRLYQQHALLAADNALISLQPRSVSLKQLAYHYSDVKSNRIHFNAWGTASKGRETPTKKLILHEASYSTCQPTQATWQIQAKKIVLDKPNNIGRVYKATLRLGTLPVLWAPYYSFQLNNARKSGFLMPVFGHADRTGYYLGMPYYFNLAPNYDLLLTPEYFGNRGFRALAKFRYLTAKSSGFLNASLLPNDKVFRHSRQIYADTYPNTALYRPYLNDLNTLHDTRGYINLQNISRFNPHLNLHLYINAVSDPYYFQDITAGAPVNESTLTNQLLNLAQTHYQNSHWDLNAYLQHYQTLNLITQIQDQSQALEQYSRLPTFALNSFYALSPQLDFALYGDYSHFAYDSLLEPSKPTGQRLHLRPGLSLSVKNSSTFIKPQIWLDAVDYDLNKTTTALSQQNSRLLPIVDVEAGLHLLRHFSLKQAGYSQTLEPRFFYLYVPHKNQDALPNFDTLQTPFYFDQLFALNAFYGIDRLENANQLSASLRSDIIRDFDGTQVLSASLGNIFYLEKPRVCLVPNCNLSRRTVSPIATKLTFNPNPFWSVSTSAAYDPYLNVANNAELTVGYHLDGRHVVNLSYKYVNVNAAALPTFAQIPQAQVSSYANTSNHLIFNFAWPISMRWSTLGYTDYDANLRRLDNFYAGIQYDSCCYALRFVTKRLFSGSQIDSNGRLKNSFDTGYFIELTLKGLGSFGSGSSAFLSSLIPGYRPHQPLTG